MQLNQNRILILDTLDFEQIQFHIKEEGMSVREAFEKELSMIMANISQVYSVEVQPGQSMDYVDLYEQIVNEIKQNGITERHIDVERARLANFQLWQLADMDDLPVRAVFVNQSGNRILWTGTSFQPCYFSKDVFGQSSEDIDRQKHFGMCIDDAWVYIGVDGDKDLMVF